MATPLPKPCAEPRCPNVTNETRCQEHRKPRRGDTWQDRKDDPAQRFYSSRAWQTTRSAYKASNPLCERCEAHGKVVVGQVVHHVTPIKEGGEKLAWSNLRHLCRDCHREAHE